MISLALNSLALGPSADAPMHGVMMAARLGALDLLLHPAGVAMLPETGTLIVADLHLDKAASFAARGALVPPHDTLATLERLATLVDALRPRSIVLLGDSFHSEVHTLDEAPRAFALIAAMARAADLVWIAGNHDPAPPCALPGRVAAEIEIAGVVLRHMPAQDGRAEIVGHLHPAARLMTRAGGQRRRAFLLSARRLILPAFGGLTGALDARNPAIASLFPDRQGAAFLICREKLARVPLSAVLG